AGFTQIVQELTRVTNTSATLIDLIVTNNYLLEEITGDFPQISDHRIIGCVLDVQHEIKTEEMKYKRKFNKENINTIIAELYGKDWDYSTTDVDLLYEKFMKNITETVNKVVPLENTQTRKQPWINRQQNKNVLSYDNIEFEEDAGSVQENFNNFYAKSIKEIADKIPKIAPTFQELPQLSDGLSSFNTISIDQLRKRVMELKNKSTADDICTVKFLKTAFCVLGYPLLHLINASLTTGKVPKAIKTSVIVPIPKVSSPNKPAQYRPINLLPVIDKILETEVCAQLREFLEARKLLFEGQSGFREKHSCESALQYVSAVFGSHGLAVESLRKLDPLVNMASNADSCDSCKDNFVVNSKYIECSICEGRYHTVCVSVKDSWLKLFSDWVNFSWSCDKCILKSQSREQQLASEIAALKKEIEFLTHEKNLSSKMIEQLEYTNNLQKSVIDSHQQQAAHSTMNSVMLPSRSTASSTLSFSDAIKKIPNRSSVLLIKSDSNSGNNDILRDVTTSFRLVDISTVLDAIRSIKSNSSDLQSRALDILEWKDLL
ncbi:unnamed protein product, partial [Acanthoscelides obtectus]